MRQFAEMNHLGKKILDKQVLKTKHREGAFKM